MNAERELNRLSNILTLAPDKIFPTEWILLIGADLDKLVIANISNGSIDLAKNLENSIEDIYSNLKLFINACYDLDCKYYNKVCLMWMHCI